MILLPSLLVVMIILADYYNYWCLATTVTNTVLYNTLYILLVVWNMNFIFPYIGNVIIPTDERVGIPPTSHYIVDHVHYIIDHSSIPTILDGLYNSVMLYNTIYMAMDQYLLIQFLGGWTSINPSYFDVNYRGTRFWHTAIYIYIHT